MAICKAVFMGVVLVLLVAAGPTGYISQRSISTIAAIC